MDSILFILKKLISRILFPVGLTLSLGIVGVIYWLARPDRRIGPALVIIAGVSLWAFSTPWLASSLITPLEKIAGPYAQPQELALKGIKHIVVLGGSQRNSKLTPADQCGGDTALRVLEGVRLWKGLPGSRLIFAGGSFSSRIPAAEAMAALAEQLGVPRQAMVLETASWDTSDQARILSAKLGQTPFALVTSASHMPRSLLLFKAHGSNPISAPCDFTKFAGTGKGFTLFVPQAWGLSLSERAVYEYLGMLYFELRSVLGLEGTVSLSPGIAPGQKNE
jgi:uncharacterized SAM-binding protein YcdF (DUF218 family)